MYACLLAVVVTAVTYLSAFLIFQRMEHFKKFNSAVGKKEVDIGMVALYAGIVAAPVAILALIGCVLWNKRKHSYKTIDWSNIGRHGRGDPVDTQIQNMSKCLGMQPSELKKIHAGPKFARLVQQCEKRGYQPLDSFETALRGGRPTLGEVF